MNRRGFLKISSLAAISVFLGDLRMVDAKNFRKKTDFHAHAILPSYIEGLKKLKIDAQAEEGFPIPKWSAENHLKFMEEAGIDFTILSMATPHIYNDKDFQKYRAERFQFLKNLRLLPVNGIVLEQKDGEVGKFVVTTKFEVKAENLIEFQNLMSDEYFRAVEKNSDVVGMFLTAEKENPNIFHTMNIFKDENSYKNYLNSAENKNLREKIKNMILSEKNIEYLPTKISMTGKGARK